MIGWLADFFRFGWGLLYWNARKTRFRWARGRVACPCQSPSDSGRAFETSCEAALPWDKPARFHKICPLLQRDAKGQLCCSVNTADVRPFWSRAFYYLGGGLAGCLLLVTFGAFGLLRGVGYPITLRQVAWPRAWSEFPHVQSRYFAAKASRSFADKNVPDAMASLALAYQLDPQNYAAGILLARLWQTGQPAYADRVYERLLVDHPDKRAGTLAAWYEALLLRGDFKGIIPLATEALKADPAQPNAWIYALLFALRREPNPGALQTLANDHTLPGDSQAVFALELLTQTNAREASQAALLRSAPATTSGYLDYYRSKRLIELGDPQDALNLLQKNAANGAPRGDETIALILDAYAATGWPPSAQNEIAALLSSPPSTSTVELLCAHLVRHPNISLLNLLEKALRQNPLPPVDKNYRATMALLCATGACGDMEKFLQTAESARQIAGSDVRALSTVESFFRDPKTDIRVESTLPALQPLSLDLTYAMLEHYYRHRPAAVSEK